MCGCKDRLERLERFAERISDALEHVREECKTDNSEFARTFTGPRISDPEDYTDIPDWER